MSVRVESNSYLTEDQQRVYQLRSSLERNGGTPVGFLDLLAAVVADDTWRKVPSGVNGEDVPFTSFSDFLEAKPPFGLGTKVENVRILLQMHHPHEGVPEIRGRMDTMRAEVDRLLGPDPEQDPINRDARGFGAYMRAGGWMFGLMVARSVEPGKGGGGFRITRDRSDRNERADEAHDKVSATDFALRAGCSKERVMRFYKAWERAAETGIVPVPGELKPGQDIDLPEPELWSEHFTSYERTDRRESIAQQAELAGTSYTDAVKVAEHPSALRTAILGDAKTAEAARGALMERMENDPELQVTIAKRLAQAPEVRKAVAVEARRAEHADYVRKAAEQGRAKTPAGQVIDLPERAKEKAAEHLSVVENPDAEPDAVSAAYEAVQAIISEAVDADPEILTREQRTRFRKALSTTAKSIESIDPDDLIAVADDDLRSTLTALQKKVNELAEVVAPATSNRLRAV